MLLDNSTSYKYIHIEETFMTTTENKFRRGTTVEHAAFTGAIGEVTVDTTLDTLVVHDGSTAGGIPAARKDGVGSLVVGRTPASASATGTAGTVVWDTSYIYVCVATDTWLRASIATW